MPGALRVQLHPGDAVMFNSFMLHRGRYHADCPRRTLMLTYSSPDNRRNDYFTNQPWFLEPGHLDGLAPRTRALFERYIELFTPFWRSRAAQAPHVIEAAGPRMGGSIAGYLACAPFARSPTRGRMPHRLCGDSSSTARAVASAVSRLYWPLLTLAP